MRTRSLPVMDSFGDVTSGHVTSGDVTSGSSSSLLPKCGLNRTDILLTCLMSLSRFSLRDKVALRLLKLHFNGADVVEWPRALDVRLSEWCCSVSMVWVQIPSREEQKFDSSKI
jgi:hypothetical protein